jgi:hypothetical protein
VIQLPAVVHERVRLRGGLDLTTPTLELSPGFLRDTLNWEVSITGGYSRIGGYERFDGRPSPASASFAGLTASALTTIAVGDTINGETSGATGVVIAIEGTLVYYTKASGAFLVGENLREGVTVNGTVTALSAAVSSPKRTAELAALAGDAYRADIQAVPGSGPIRGVAYYKSTVYAWRDNAAGTALVMHRASASGWQTVSLGTNLDFTAGLVELLDGEVVTGATSGAAAVALRVATRSGTWGSTAAGTLALGSVTGTFVNGEALQVAGVPRATVSGAPYTPTLNPGGRVVTDQSALGGGSAGARLYGADGANYAFEFDGTAFLQIKTGMATDQPELVKCHANQVFLTYDASLQHSAVGDPFRWSVVLGAGELALDSTVQGLSTLPGSTNNAALCVYSTHNTSILYGTSIDDWNLAQYNQGTGGARYTNQVLASAYVLDDRGLIELAASQNYGNFQDATLTNHVRPWLLTRRNRGTASVVSRDKSQYRVFFSDGYGLYVTISNGKLLGCMPVLFPNPVTVACEGETPDGTETQFFGSTNGFVYRLDVGPNFDGAEINAVMLLTYNSHGDSRVIRSYRRGNLEITGTSYAEIGVGYDLNYSDAVLVDMQGGLPYANNFSAPFWDSFVWDSFVWDGLSLGPTDFEVKGNGVNIAVRIENNSRISNPFTINSMILHYIPRRGVR